MSGADYGTVTADDIAVTVGDDETVSSEVTLTVDPATLDEGDGGTTVTVTGTLNGGTRNAATAVTVSVGASDDSAVEGTDYATVEDLTLTIGVGQTAATQTFMLIPTDDDVDGADKTLTIAGSTTGLTVNPTAVTIADDDERGVEVGVTLADGSGGRQCDLHGGADLAADRDRDGDTVGERQQRGDGERRADLHRVRLEPGADGDGLGAGRRGRSATDTATVAHTVSGADYGTVTADDIAVTVGDDETVSSEVTLTVDPATLDEGDGGTTVTVTGTLNGGTRNAATAVTVSVGASDDSAVEGTDYATVEDLTLTIGVGQTAATQTFMLIPTDDDVDGADKTLTIAGSTTGLTVNPTAVTIADDDERGVEVGVTSLMVPEGGSATYTVALTSQPTGTVTVTPSVNGNSEVTVSSALTFTASDWNQAQTVTVSAQDDADAATDNGDGGAHGVGGRLRNRDGGRYRGDGR